MGLDVGIWPLLVILFALGVERLGIDRLSIALAALIVGVTLIAAVRYVVLEERLKYAKVFEPANPTSRSSSPGPTTTSRATTRRPPGEDLLHDRTPFARAGVDVHRTINPFDAKAIASLPNVRWVIVKKRPQLNGTPMENEEEVLRLMAPHHAGRDAELLRLPPAVRGTAGGGRERFPV